jgi:integrase
MEPYVEPIDYRGAVATTSTPRKRSRGEIETLPSGSLRVRVYAGIDPALAENLIRAGHSRF